MQTDSPPRKPSLIDRFLLLIERGGNALPHPSTLFLIFAVLVVLGSWVAARSGIEAVHPGNGEIIRPVSLLSVPGLHRILTEMVTNFTGFAPLGTVMVALLGIGVAEASGLIGVVMRLFVLSAPRKLLTLVVVFSGVLSNVGSEIGYVLLVPLAATIFKAAGRHPIAGLAAAFAGVSGGYSANLLLGTVDPLLQGLTEEAAHIIDPSISISAACNLYFMQASTFVVAIVGTLVTELVVIPRLGEWKGEDGEANEGDELRALDEREKLGLWVTLAAALLMLAWALWATVPADGFMRDPVTGDLLKSPFMKSIVAMIFIAGALLGVVYGLVAGTFRNDEEVMNGMGKSMSTLGGYLVLVFFAAQFVAYFKWTNLGLIIAVQGADWLKSSGLGGIPLLIAFVLLSALMNLFIGSASAKWALMAPIFVPMLMLLDYDPALTQLAYRIGDSTTNIISPMMSYFALIIAFFQRYEKKAGIGTLVATMLPYSFAFLGVWIVMMIAWVGLGLPLGPG